MFAHTYLGPSHTHFYTPCPLPATSSYAAPRRRYARLHKRRRARWRASHATHYRMTVDSGTNSATARIPRLCPHRPSLTRRREAHLLEGTRVGLPYSTYAAATCHAPGPTPYILAFYTPLPPHTCPAIPRLLSRYWFICVFALRVAAVSCCIYLPHTVTTRTTTHLDGAGHTGFPPCYLYSTRDTARDCYEPASKWLLPPATGLGGVWDCNQTFMPTTNSHNCTFPHTPHWWMWGRKNWGRELQ